jgi:hypothetical protein
MSRSNLTAQAIDDALAGSFPASDPPAWTPGMARPAPEIETELADRQTGNDQTADLRTHVIDASHPPDAGRTCAQAVVSLIGAVGLALLVPLAILAGAAPGALGVRGALEVAVRILAFVA